MEWFVNLFTGDGVAQSVIVIALTIAIGILLGKIRFFGISLGVTFILFVGILLGELGMTPNGSVLHFFKEFGLILFVFSIGLQVGPGFFDNLRKGGSTLNGIAVGVVLLGGGVTLALHYVTGMPMTTLVGIMSGAVTNTPGLGAAQQAYTDATGVVDETIAMGYAVAYPLGMVGIILTIITLRFLTGVNMNEEERKLYAVTEENNMGPEPLSLEVANPALKGITLAKLGEILQGNEFVVSRVWKRDTRDVIIAASDTRLETGDRIFVIADHKSVEPVTLMVGHPVKMDRTQWIPTQSNLDTRRVVVTNREMNGKRLFSLKLREVHGVNVTRVHRAGLEFVPGSDIVLQYGDKLTIVGSDAALNTVEKILGNSIKHLNEPNLLTIFLGIALGVLLGSVPIFIPGVPQPLKFGLAGGPLIVSILMARFGSKYKLVTYTTPGANLMLREVGICIFLACVGLGAGDGFVDTIVNQGGLYWVGYGVLITVVPLLIMGLIARWTLKVNYFTLAGVLSGSMTDPPALAFSSTLTGHNAPQLGYATVYPLTMFLRILVAQILILFFV